MRHVLFKINVEQAWFELSAASGVITGRFAAAEPRNPEYRDSTYSAIGPDGNHRWGRETITMELGRNDKEPK